MGALFLTISFAIVVNIGVCRHFPWIYKDGNDYKGIITDIINRLASENNLKIKYLYKSESELFERLKNAKLDIIVGPVEEGRILGFKSSKQILFEDWPILYKRKDNPITIIGLSDLNNATIAVQDSLYLYTLKKRVEKSNITMNFKVVNDSSEAIKLLENGKVDFALINSDITLSSTYYHISQTIFQPFPIKIGFIFSNNLPKEIMNEFDSGLFKMKNRKDSFYYRTVAKYDLYHKEIKVNLLPWWIPYLYITLGLSLSSLLIATVWLQIKAKNKVKKLKQMNSQIEKQTDNLQKSKKELEQLNIELEESYKSINSYAQSLDELYNIFSAMINENIDIEEMSERILSMVVQSIPEADAGSISIIKNGKWYFLATVGHDKDLLNSIDLPAKYFLMPKKTILIKNIKNEDLKIMPKEIYEPFSKAVLPIKESLLAPIKIGIDVRGNLALDILQNSNHSFSNETYKSINSFSSLLSSFLSFYSYTRIQNEFQRELVFTILHVLDIHDPYTEGHSEFVADYSANLAKLMGFDEDFQSRIYWAGILHDIGKIGIPKRILSKNGPLTKEEWEKIKEHPLLGYKIVTSSERLKDIADIIKYHHERYDGKGYPEGLSGEEIPIGARIMAVVDSWEAMTTDRVYKKALNFEDALNELIKKMGTQFDPEVVRFFLKLLHREI